MQSVERDEWRRLVNDVVILLLAVSALMAGLAIGKIIKRIEALETAQAERSGT